MTERDRQLPSGSPTIDRNLMTDDSDSLEEVDRL